MFAGNIRRYGFKVRVHKIGNVLDARVVPGEYEAGKCAICFDLAIRTRCQYGFRY